MYVRIHEEIPPLLQLLEKPVTSQREVPSLYHKHCSTTNASAWHFRLLRRKIQTTQAINSFLRQTRLAFVQSPALTWMLSMTNLWKEYIYIFIENISGDYQFVLYIILGIIQAIILNPQRSNSSHTLPQALGRKVAVFGLRSSVGYSAIGADMALEFGRDFHNTSVIPSCHQNTSSIECSLFLLSTCWILNAKTKMVSTKIQLNSFHFVENDNCLRICHLRQSDYCVNSSLIGPNEMAQWV